MGVTNMNPNLPFQMEPIDLFPQAEEVFMPVGAASKWDKAHDQIAAISRLREGWDGDGADPIRPEIARATARLLRFLRSTGYMPPQDIYPMPDGTITIEWQMPDDVIQRIEVEGSGHGQMMISYPDRPATFKSIKWPVAARPLSTNMVGEDTPAHLHFEPIHTRKRPNSETSENGNFQLAA